MKTKDYKHYKRGKMVRVRWRNNWYEGKYYGWDKADKRHMVRFPILGPYGIGLQILLVKNGSNIYDP